MTEPSKVQEGIGALEKTLPLLEKHGLAAAVVICLLIIVAIFWFFGRYLVSMTGMLTEQVGVNKDQAKDIGEIKTDLSGIRSDVAVLVDRKDRKAPRINPPVLPPASPK